MKLIKKYWKFIIGAVTAIFALLFIFSKKSKNKKLESTQKKIDTNAKIADCQVDQRVCKQMQDSYKYYISQLEGKLKKNNSWFDRNRGTVGIFTGLLLGTGLSVGIVHAVYQK